MDYQTLILEKNDGIATLTFNRPDKMNSVNQDMRIELLGVLDALEKDDDTRVVVFTGAGRGFCAGADIGEFVKAESDAELQKETNKYMFQIAQRIFDFEKATIGAINGVAAGDGAQYVLAFDLNVASEKAKIGWIATALGILWPYGLTRLPGEVGRFRAKEVLMTKRFLSAQEASEWGIVAKVVPHEDLMQAAMELAGEINKMPPLSIRAIKKAINQKAGDHEHSCQILGDLQQTEDAKEGTRAFLEKRDPQFKGM